MAKFEVGHKKVGGIQEGTKHKKTKQWEAFSEYCLTGGLKKFKEEIEKLNGKDYVVAFTNLLEFHAPKLVRSDINLKGELTNIEIEKTVLSKNV